MAEEGRLRRFVFFPQKSGIQNGHGGVPGLPGIEVLTSTRARIPFRGHPWAAPGVRMVSGDVSGELPEAFWRGSGSSWGALGALFGSFFSIEK